MANAERTSEIATRSADSQAPEKSHAAGSRLGRRVVVRILANFATLVIISFLVFVVMSFKTPENVARSVLGRDVSQQQLDAFIAKNQLDAPLVHRYAIWASKAVTGNFGESLLTGRPVSKEIQTRLVRTVLLAAIGGTLGVALGVFIGVMQARRFGSKFDVGFTGANLGIAAVPEFLVAMLLYLVFVIWLKWFPTQSGFAFSFGGLWDRVLTLILPAVTVALLVMPHVARLTRATTVEALSAPYVDAARLRGLDRRTVVWDHAFRNSAVPVVSAIGLAMTYAVSGLLTVEVVFGFPGIGSLLIQTLASGDVLVSQGIILVFAVIIISINILVDIATFWLNPRLRYVQ